MKDVNKALIMGLILAGCTYPIKIAVEPNQFKAQKLETKLNIAKAESNLKICSWNIQNFGESKAKNLDIMNKIASEIAKCDIIALQEISNVYEQSDINCSRNENKCPENKKCSMIRNSLETHLNENLGLKYKFIFSPQVKDERYLFVYNPDKVKYMQSNLMKDSKNIAEVCSISQTEYGFMVREPFIGKFKAGNFEFKLLTAHTQPSNNINELNALEMFYREAEEEDKNKNVILLGDLNASCSYLKKNESIAFRSQRYYWVIGDDEDTTVSQTTFCAYDRFIFTSSAKNYYAGKYGVERSISKEVSDHYKIWAEFRTDLKQE